MIPFAYSHRNLRVRWKTTLMTASGFTLVVAALVVILAFVKVWLPPEHEVLFWLTVMILVAVVLHLYSTRRGYSISKCRGTSSSRAASRAKRRRSASR